MGIFAVPPSSKACSSDLALSLVAASKATAKAVKKRRRLQDRPSVQRFLAALIAFYIRLVDRTGRFEVLAPPAVEALIRDGQPFIGAFWHGRLMMIYPAWRRLLAGLGVEQRRQPYVISSSHGDGKLIQLATNRFGLKVIWGSSRRGGMKALIKARRILQQGDIVVMTPDGPRGPRMRAHPGVAYLAEKAKVPVVPVTFAIQSQRTFKSWDRFMLVWPFARGVLAFGDPIQAKEGDDTESLRRRIEDGMIAFARGVDHAEGLDPIEPAN